ncbi:hypothetical protein [Winogradskyella sediminis]|uniref:LTXXQ motif family protein n=1 Tax=Winogradskyella sediminis TaxID=1382466 RepID=A0A1H1U5Y0_9FLAO|nr:hypothetical protein [Winogradskyella sediminis]REG88790.1 hypothetical protein C8N41_10120 [Winogradskyella sediminis]SDS67900.1 hypothetical protein SAMN04489797_2145 [Winogradskyella sediminis]
MKKIITLCLFVFALFLGTQTTVAQNSKLEMIKTVNAEAAEKTEALRKFVKFDNQQRDQIYEAQQEFIRDNYLIEKQNVADKNATKKIEAIAKQLETKMQNILSDDQYERYKQFLRS